MTRFAVIRSRESAFWQGITHLLQANGRADVSVFRSLEALSESADQAFDVAIVPWSQSADGYPWLDHLGHPHSRAVVGVDDSTNEAVVWLREIDHKSLLDLSQHLGGRPAIETQGTANIISLSVRQDDTDGSSKVRTHVHDLLKWVELVVRKRLTGNDGDPATETSPIPGWTASLTQMRDRIGGQAGETRDSLEAALEQLDRRFSADGLVAVSGDIGLDALDQHIVALALAPELDGRFQAVYGYLHNDLTRGHASATLLCDLLTGPGVDALAIRQRLFDDGPIAELRLLEAEENADGRIGPESALRVPADFIDVQTRGWISERALGPALSFAPAQLAPILESPASRDLLAAIDDASERRPRLIQLIAPKSAADWAKTILAGAGRRVLRIDASRADDTGYPALERFAAKVARICKSTQALPLLEGARARASRAHDLTVLVPDLAGMLIVDLEHPTNPAASFASRLIRPFATATSVDASYWQAATSMHRFEISDADAVELASTRRDDPALVASICRHASATAEDGGMVDRTILQAIAASLSTPKSAGLVRRLRPVFTWDDIVLRADRLAQLHDITAHVRHAARVMDDWGYGARLPYGQGVAALFAGPSGTGKTMTAQIIAADLGVEVFQVDLAKTVSKYIGETEKHLDAAFEDAERASAVLLFDEADALFGKRTEVKDAHDRHANVEVAYLLQRLEQFQGLVILTTNFKQNIDAAFIRRLRFSVDFPGPDAGERLEIWRRAFPKATPTSDTLDLAFLAERFKLTGGHIQQIALMAAFLAAEDGRIEMTHVMAATRQQLSKLGMVSAEKSLSEMAPPAEALSA